MRYRTFVNLIAIVLMGSLIYGCAWFRGQRAVPSEGSGKAGSSDVNLSNIDFGSESGLPPDLSSEGELSPRPKGKWIPVKNKKASIYFAFDESRIGTSQVPVLEAVAKYMLEHPNIGLIIEGNCDQRGSKEYNLGLGERRAIAARDFLVKLGVPDNRIQTISYGSERPVDPRHTEGAYAKNRRDDLVPAIIGSAKE